MDPQNTSQLNSNNIPNNLQTPVPPPTPPQTPQSKSSLKVVLILILLIILAGAGFYFIKLRQKVDNDMAGTQVQKVSAEDQAKIESIYNDLKNGGLTEKDSAYMNLIAQDRVVGNIDTSSMKYSEAFGYKFKTPWGVGTISERTRSSSTLKQLEFKNGKAILFTCFPGTPREEFTTVDVDGETPWPKEDTDQILKFLGTKADSGFDYLDTLFSLNMESVKKAGSVESAMAISKLLVLKSVTLPSAGQPYRFAVGDIQGFQYGNYSEPQNAFIYIFTKDKRGCNIAANERNSITQKDVDVILSTFSVI